MSEPKGTLQLSKIAVIRVLTVLLHVGLAFLAATVVVNRIPDKTGYLSNSTGSLLSNSEPLLCNETVFPDDEWQGWSRAVQMVPMPYVEVHYCPNVRSPQVNTNDLGYRGTVNYADQISDAQQFKAAGGSVVVFTGGSAAFGAYSDSDEASTVGYLNSIFEAQGENIKVYNFGMGYYTSATEVAAMLFYAADLDPDVIVVFNGYVDLVRVFWPAEQHAHNVKQTYFSQYIRNLYPLKYTSAFLDQIVSIEHVDAVIANYEANETYLAQYTLGAGIKLILSVEPLKGLKNNCGIDNEYIRAMLDYYPRLVESIQTVATKYDHVQALDLTDMFSQEPDACFRWADRVHLTSAGQQVLAETLAPRILQALSSE